MKNMKTNVESLKQLGLDYNDNQHFTEMILSETLDYITGLASILRKIADGDVDTTGQLADYIASLPSYQSVEKSFDSKIKTYLNKVTYCLKLDTENNVIENCYYYKQFNEIAEAFLRDGAKGVKEYFHPFKPARTPEEEAKYQQGISELLGI